LSYPECTDAGTAEPVFAVATDHVEESMDRSTR